MVPAFGSLRSSGFGRVIEINEAKLRELLTPVLQLVEVDEEYYRNANPDVDEKIRAGELDSAKYHYVVSGYYEDRLPRRVAVDEPWYLAEYPDVAEAVARHHFSSASQHFGVDGFREGRLPHRGWSLRGSPPAAADRRPVGH